jgi:hypothetical protein
MNNKQQKNGFPNQSQKEGLNWTFKLSLQLSPQARKTLIQVSGFIVPLLTAALYHFQIYPPNFLDLPTDQTVIDQTQHSQQQ